MLELGLVSITIFVNSWDKSTNVWIWRPEKISFERREVSQELWRPNTTLFVVTLSINLIMFNFWAPITHSFHYHLQVQTNSKKNCTKKPMQFLASMGKTGLSHDIFFKFSLRPFEVIEVEWPRLVKFWGRNLESVTLFFKVWLLTSKR